MTAQNITGHLIEDCVSARAHFEVWWALRNRALPEFHQTMSEYRYLEFFLTSNAGHYNLIFIFLSRIFDDNPRTASMNELKRALHTEGHTQLASGVARRLKPHRAVIAKVLSIRNQKIAHNDKTLSRSKVYQINGVTPNEIRAAIDCACETIDHVAESLGMSVRVAERGRLETATLKMLATLRRGAGLEEDGAAGQRLE